jgi:hypothetical protein
MPRFYLHLWTGSEYIADQVGDDLANAEAAYLEAFEAAQEMVGDLIRGRKDVSQHQFNVVDHAGRAVFELPFTEVLGGAMKSRRPARATDTRRRQVLMSAVAHEIGVARIAIAAAKETLARSGRSRAGP